MADNGIVVDAIHMVSRCDRMLSRDNGIVAGVDRNAVLKNGNVLESIV